MRLVKSKMTLLKKYVQSTFISNIIVVGKTDITALEKRVKINEGLYDKFDEVQSQIETSAIRIDNEATQLLGETFDKTSLRITSYAEKR